MTDTSDQESIWSVYRDDLKWYSWLFPIFWVIGVSLHLWQHCLTDVVPAIATAGLAAAVLALMFLFGKELVIYIARQAWPRIRRSYHAIVRLSTRL